MILDNLIPGLFHDTRFIQIIPRSEGLNLEGQIGWLDPYPPIPFNFKEKNQAGSRFAVSWIGSNLKSEQETPFMPDYIYGLELWLRWWLFWGMMAAPPGFGKMSSSRVEKGCGATLAYQIRNWFSKLGQGCSATYTRNVRFDLLLTTTTTPQEMYTKVNNLPVVDFFYLALPRDWSINLLTPR